MLHRILIVTILFTCLCHSGHGEVHSEDPTIQDNISEMLETDGGLLVVWVSLSLMIGIVLSIFLHEFKVNIISESVIVIGLGAVLGLILPTNGTKVGVWKVGNVSIETEGLINEAVLNLFLLPVIIFEAGWSMRHKDFISQLPYILLFAVFGTLISMFVVGHLILATSSIHGIRSPRTALTYAALISAVDPVATLATYTHLNVDPLLNVLVFGESVINDAVAITLFRILNAGDAKTFDQMNTAVISAKIAGDTCRLSFGSFFLGIACGIIYVLVIRFTNMRSHAGLASLFIILCSFLTYSLAEHVCSMSGIITVLFCSMLMSAFGKNNLSSEGNLLVAFALKQTSSLADMAVFLFVGVTIAYMSAPGLIFGLLVVAFCLLGRLAAVLPLSLLTNSLKTCFHRRLTSEQRMLLDWKHIFMIWHAGLRGGIALVLTLELGSWVDEVEGKGTKDVLRNATVIVICFFLVIFGGSTQFLLHLLKVPMKGNAARLSHHHGRCWQLSYCIRDKIFEPLLVGKVSPALHFQDGPVRAAIFDIDTAHCTGNVVSGTSADSINLNLNRDRMVALFGTRDPGHVGGIEEASESDTDDVTSTEEDEAEDPRLSL